MIEPRLADGRLVADIEGAPRNPAQFHLWWLGQSGFLLHWNGSRLLFDPYLSDSLTAKYEGTSKPHVRISRRTIDPAMLHGIEVITSTHQHTDHLDRETLVPLLETNPEAILVAPRGSRTVAASRIAPHESQLRPIDAGESVSIGPWLISALPAAHETIERDAEGFHRFLGYIVRFGEFAVYHAGDTLRYDGQAERLRAERVDVALLPINGRSPSRGVPGNMTGEEAARLAHEGAVGIAVPCHFELFAFNTASPDGFARTAASLGQRARVLELGERLDWPLPTRS